MRNQALVVKLLDVNVTVHNEDADLANIDSITLLNENLVTVVVLMQVGSNVSFCASNLLSVAHVERVTSHRYWNTSAKKSPVVFCLILWLTLNPSRDRKSLKSGKHNKNPTKRKRARSRDLAPKQRQFVSLIVKKSEPISIYEIVRICYVW